MPTRRRILCVTRRRRPERLSVGTPNYADPPPDVLPCRGNSVLNFVIGVPVAYVCTCLYSLTLSCIPCRTRCRTRRPPCEGRHLTLRAEALLLWWFFLTNNRWIPASLAAARLGLSREVVVRRLQRGDLLGRVTDAGSWVVDSADIKRFIRERNLDTAPADAPEAVRGEPQ